MKMWKISLIVVAFAAITIFASPANAQQFGGQSFVSIAGQPHDVVYDSARNQAYVSNRSLNRIDIVNSLNVTGSIATGQTPTGMSISPDGNTMLVTLQDVSQMGVINLNTLTQTKTIALPDWSGNQSQRPLRVDYASDGTVYYRHNTPNNPFGKVHTLDLSTEISTQLFPSETWTGYERSRDGSEILFYFSSARAATRDIDSQTTSPIQTISEFGSGNGGWITAGLISDDGNRIAMTRSSTPTYVYDGAFNLQGSMITPMAWGTFGDWGLLAVIVESNGGEGSSNRLSIFDTSSRTILDTLALTEVIGVSEYNFGNRPIEVTDNSLTLLAVGQTGLFVVDASNVPEPATLGLLLVGGLVLLRGRRRFGG